VRFEPVLAATRHILSSTVKPAVVTLDHELLGPIRLPSVYLVSPVEYKSLLGLRGSLSTSGQTPPRNYCILSLTLMDAFSIILNIVRRVSRVKSQQSRP
jgi:hypothetical protein